MQVSVTFRHMDATDALKAFAAEKVSKIEKYIHTPTDAHVVLSVEKHLHRAEINVSANGMRVRGEESSGDMYGSIDAAAQKIERQLKRYRNKLSTHKAREGHASKVRLSYVEPAQGELGELAMDAPSSIVETKELDANPMLVEEAIMQMDLMQTDFIVFINAKTNNVNVLYRRKEGNFGLIEPPRHPS
ncbi:MAG: ribosome-associated translation inhibitor RaiA [Deltaproteobacteria bacterium]|nr:ribosome-associated translation inhibitor RaiA [Deltaproteobacteria bacterium]